MVSHPPKEQPPPETLRPPAPAAAGTLESSCRLGGQFTESDSVPAELGPGDALVYSGYVFHGGGANRTADHWRKAMHLSVVAGWLTPEEASPLDYPLGSLAERSERVQQMLGHKSYVPGDRPGAGLWLRHVKEI